MQPRSTENSFYKFLTVDNSKSMQVLIEAAPTSKELCGNMFENHDLFIECLEPRAEIELNAGLGTISVNPFNYGIFVIPWSVYFFLSPR